MSEINRRDWLRVASLATGAVVLTTWLDRADAQEGKAKEKANPTPPAGPFTLPRLPYAYDALVPHIDARTMEIHHSRHHQAYITNLNTAVAGTELANQSIEQICRGIDQVPERIRTAVRNNGGGHYNHTLFWEIMAPNAGGQPAGALLEAINATFTDFVTFKNRLKEAALGRFGSGWAWLVVARVEGRPTLRITHTPNQDNPLMDGSGVPILGIDVWEHAYYLQYQNRRADYIDAWFNTVNWRTVMDKYMAARG